MIPQGFEVVIFVPGSDICALQPRKFDDLKI